MDRRSKIIVSVVGIFIVLLALVGITYAYFLTQVQGNTNDTSISITTANLRLVYEDATPNIEATNIQPGDTIYTKTFTVTNEGNAVIKYAVYLENVINNFVHEEDLLMFVTCSSNIEGNTCNGYGDGTVENNTPTFNESLYPLTNTKLTTNTISPASTGIDAEVHTYTLYLKFKDDGSDQSEDMGKDLQGKIQIYDPKDIVALTGTVDIDNPVTNAEYFVEIQSEPKISEIKDGSYVLHGIEPGTHTMLVKYKLNGTEAEVSRKTITVTKGTDASVSSDASSIVINDSVDYANVNINVESSGLLLGGVSVFENKFNIGTLAYEIMNNGADVETDEITGTFRDDSICGRGQECLDNVAMGCPDTCYIPGTERFVAKKTNKVKAINSVYLNEATGDSWDEEQQDFINDGIFVSEDDYGDSYFYRGPVVNNYLTFADMCWRIIRIEGDGSIKIVLEDRDQACSEEMDSTWHIPTSVNSNVYTGNFGYTEYDVGTLTASDGTKNTQKLYLMDYLNGQTNKDTSMSTAFKNFQSQFSNTELSKLKSGNWCIYDPVNFSSTPSLITNVLDRKIKSNQVDNFTNIPYLNSPDDNFSLKCQMNVVNSWGEGDTVIPMYVGGITADEVYLAGGHHVMPNDKFYLYSSESFWTLSGKYYEFDSDNVSQVGPYHMAATRVFENLSFRPVISLKSETKIIDGDGTKGDSYKIG